MMTTLFESIFSNENIEDALSVLETKKDSCGIDGIMLSDLRNYLEINKKDILEMLFNESYDPGIIKEIEIINYRGKKRKIALYNSIDRLILRCIAQVLQTECDDIFEDNCFAFRNGKGVEQAIVQAADYINDGAEWLVKIDISNYYDSIPIGNLEQSLYETILDKKLFRLIRKYLHPEVALDEGGFYKKTVGIVQGSPISPFLSNLYLARLDRDLKDKGFCYCRFADDIGIFLKNKDEAGTFFREITDDLKEKYGLEVNSAKSGVFHGLGQQYLGYSFTKGKNNIVLAVKRQRNTSEDSYSSWNHSYIQKVDRSYHIINDGILTKRDYNVLFDNEEGKKYIPVETTRAINIHSNISFSSEFFRFVGTKRLDVNLFDRFGNYIGCFVPASNGFKGRTMLKQAEIYLDSKKRSTVAKAMEIGSLHNIRSNLRYYYKHKKTPILKNAIDKISAYIVEINNCNTLDEMMLVEARARELYYRMFNEIIIDDSFKFTSRTRRPPKDALNALISFGNVYLYNRIATEINKTSLDIRIGFVHALTNRSQSLNLDIADIFKPIVVDRVIFSLINLKMISVEEHFERTDDGGVYLNKQGKRLFINSLDKKIYNKQTKNNTPISYETRIRNEVAKLYRYVMYEEKYKAYKYQ